MAKVVILGESGVGKSSIVCQLSRNLFNCHGEPTIGASHTSESFQTENGPFTLHVWDTAGQERFRAIIPMYSRGCSAVIVVYAIDSTESFNGINAWVTNIKESGEKNCRVYLVANKMDLGENQLVEEGEAVAEKEGFVFFKVSAKDHDSVVAVFTRIAEDLAADPKARNAGGVNSLLAHEWQPQTKGCC